MVNILPLAILESKSLQLRRKVLEMVYRAQSGHLAGSLSSLDILATLYLGGILRYDPKEPDSPRRDRFILSCGHVCPALYAVLAEAGFFSSLLLDQLRQFDSPLQGHPEKGRLPGIETTTGLLGQGLSIGVGLALTNGKTRVFVLASDAEQQEGQTWEAAMSATKYRLDNLVLIVDRNQIQIDGMTSKIMPLKNLKRKYEAFGWRVFETDGHDFRRMTLTLHRAAEAKKQPAVVLAHTVAGKGVPFMENKPAWHSQALSQKTYSQAIKALK